MNLVVLCIQVKLSKPPENCIHKTLQQSSYKGMKLQSTVSASWPFIGANQQCLIGNSSGRHACYSVSVDPSSSPAVNECGKSGRSPFQRCFPSDSTHDSSGC